VSGERVTSTGRKLDAQICLTQFGGKIESKCGKKKKPRVSWWLRNSRVPGKRRGMGWLYRGGARVALSEVLICEGGGWGLGGSTIEHGLVRGKTADNSAPGLAMGFPLSSVELQREKS